MNETKKRNHIFWGIAFIAASVLVILGKLGYLKNFNVFTFLATLLFVISLIKGILKIHFGTIFFSVAFLAILYAQQLHMDKLGPWTILLVAGLATIGFQILFQNAAWRKKIQMHHDFSPIAPKNIEDLDGEVIHQKTSFSGVTKYIHSENLKEIDLDCSFSGVQIFLDNAKISNGYAVIRVHATFSGIELYVPKNWQIENHVDIILGGVDFKNKNEPSASITLDIIGDMTFSGINVTYI